MDKSSRDEEEQENKNSTIQLEDLLASYPDQNDPLIQQIVDSKLEFSSNKTEVTEKKLAKKGDLYSHQKLTRNLLKAMVNRLLILDKPGTGKTCSIIGYTEYCRKEREKALRGMVYDEANGHFLRVIVIVDGKKQRSEFKHQLVCKCTSGYYDVAISSKANTFTKRENEINRKIKQFYEIKTFHSFAKEIAGLGKDAEIRTRYSHTIFFVDEIHLLVTSGESKDMKNLRKKTTQYNLMKKVFRLVEQSKIIIATGTPMTTSVRDLIPIIDLLNDEDVSEDNPNFDFSLTELEKYLRGKVTYIAESKYGVIPKEMGEKINQKYILNGEEYTSQLTLQLCKMSPFQQKSYMNAISKIPKNINEEEVRGGDGWSIGPRHASICVFPDGSYGTGNVSQDAIEKAKKKRAERLAKQKAQRLAKKKELEKKKKELEKKKKATQKKRRSSSSSESDEEEDEEEEEEDEEESEIEKESEEEDDEEESEEEDEDQDVGLDELLYENFMASTNKPEKEEEEENKSKSEEEEEESEKEEESRDDYNAFMKYVIIGSNGNFRPTHEYWNILTGAERYPDPPVFTTKKILEIIYKYSCKYAFIINQILNNPKENAFCYGEYVLGSGSIVFSIFLEAVGFTKFTETESVFSSKENTTYCGTETHTENRAIREIPGKNYFRYAVLTPGFNTEKARYQTLMQAFNSSENLHGKIIRCFITSRIGREGISVNSIKQDYLIGGEWTAAAIEQALKRSIRVTSSTDLLEEEKKKLKSETEEPTVTIKIYKLAACMVTKTDKLMLKPKDNIDVRMYIRAEKRDREIKNVERKLRIISLTCNIHKERNTRIVGGRSEYEDGSPECDYQECDYACWSDNPKNPNRGELEQDYSSYDVFYAEEATNVIIEEIKKYVAGVDLYSNNNFTGIFTIKELTESLYHLSIINLREKIILMALERIISERIILHDRFGFHNYLREYGNYYFLTKNIESNNNIGDGNYSYYLIGLNSKSSLVLADEFRHQYVASKIQYIKTLQTKREISKAMKDFNRKEINILVEDVFIDYLKGVEAPYVKIILDDFNVYIYKFNEPRAEITRRTKNYMSGKKGPGRPTKENKTGEGGVDEKTAKYKTLEKIKEEMKSWATEDEDETSVVYIHNLASREIDRTHYNEETSERKAQGKIRIFDKSELYIKPVWRDATRIEREIYNTLIQYEKRKQDKYLDTIIYGIYKDDFKIRQPVGHKTKNMKEQTTGKVCSYWNIPDLLDIMYRINMPLPQELINKYSNSADKRTVKEFRASRNLQLKNPKSKSIPLDKKERKDMIETIIASRRRSTQTAEDFKTLNNNRIFYYYNWSIPFPGDTKKITKIELCDMIHDFMKKNKLMRTDIIKEKFGKKK